MMSAMTKVLCAAAAVSMMAACGGPDSAWESGGANLTPSMPPLQTFAKWDGRTPFVPSYGPKP